MKIRIVLVHCSENIDEFIYNDHDSTRVFSVISLKSFSMDSK